jgi:TonB family protein
MVFRGFAVTALAMAFVFPSLAAKPSSPMPLSNTGNWITPDDYPHEALVAKQAGTVGFRLDVGVSGSVSSCTVTLSSGLPVLDKAACDLLTARGRFTPALDKRGKPTAGTYSSSVRWQIPNKRLPFPLAAHDEMIEFDVTRDGTIENCTDQGAKSPTTFCDRFDRVIPQADGPAVGTQHVIARTSVVIENRPAPKPSD